MTKSNFAVVLLSTSLFTAPALAQEATQPEAAEPATAAAPEAAETEAAAPAELTPEQIEAQNQAIADFQAAQQAQQAGDHATALAKIDAALPTIRMMADRDPSNIQNAGFLASALMLASNSQGAMGNIDAIAPLYAEAAPLWRKVYQSDSSNTGVRNTLASVLVNLGNFNLVKQNKEAAQPFFQEALDLAKSAYETNPASAEMANAVFASLIGLNQVTGEMDYLDQAKTVGEEMRAKGIVSAANEPSVNALLGAA